MRILSIRPVHAGSGKVVARFDAELDSGVRAYELKLAAGPNGWRVYGPSLGTGAVVTFPPSIVDELAALAKEALADGTTYKAA